MFRRLSLAIATGLLLVSQAAAGQIVAWDSSAFANAQAANTPIVIHVTASWCPTCKAQHPTIEALAADPANPDLIVFNVDFDSQKDVLREFNVRSQSTLIAFRGQSEVDRSVGVTDPAAIAKLFAATL